jgi:hypothetical protein
MITLDFRNVDERNIQISKSSQLVDVTVMSEPDPAWNYIDEAGHAHRWTNDFKLPTLDEVVDWMDVDEDGEEYVLASHYECKVCRARVYPGLRPGQQSYVAGLQRITIAVTVPQDWKQTQVVLDAIQNNEKCRLRLPFGVPDQTGYITRVSTGPDGIDLSISGAGPYTGE